MYVYIMCIKYKLKKTMNKSIKKGYQQSVPSKYASYFSCLKLPEELLSAKAVTIQLYHNFSQFYILVLKMPFWLPHGSQYQ